MDQVLFCSRAIISGFMACCQHSCLEAWTYFWVHCFMVADRQKLLYAKEQLAYDNTKDRGKEGLPEDVST